MSKRNLKYHLLILFFGIAMIFSAILSFVPVSTLCDSELGLDSTCSKVLSSQFSKTFGISNSYLGLVAFVVLFTLTIFQMKKPSEQKEQILMFATVITSLFAVYLIYLQTFVIVQFCKYCMVVDVSSILAFITIIYFGMD